MKYTDQLPLRKWATPKLWSSLSHRRKMRAKELYRRRELLLYLYSDGRKMYLDPPIKVLSHE